MLNEPRSPPNPGYSARVLHNSNSHDLACHFGNLAATDFFIAGEQLWGNSAVTVADREPVRVLVVDDCRDTAVVLAALLERLGYQAMHCTNPTECIGLALKLRPQLVLLDLAMPARDGFEVARDLRAAELPPFRMIALSGYYNAAIKDRCQAAGFDGFRMKPIFPHGLRELVESARALTDHSQHRPPDRLRQH